MYITIKNNLISVYSLKKEIGIDDINIYFNGKQLEDNRTLFEYNIKKNDRVNVVKKNRGGKLTGGEIFGYVILLIVYVGILLSGLIPFISFIISNIIIKSLVFVVDFIKDKIDPNNWINSFMDFVKESCIPIIRFFFDFGIISIVMYFLTFACVYQLYKEKWGPANICQAFKNSSTLAMFMTMFMTLIYAIANSPTFIERILTPIFPSFLGGILRTCFNGLSRFRGWFISMLPGSGIMLMVAELLTISIAFISKYSFLVEDSLSYYIQFYKKFMMNDDYRVIAEQYGFKEVLSILFRIEKFEEGQYSINSDIIPDERVKESIESTLDTPYTRKDNAYFYITRSIYQSVLYVFSNVVYLFDICGSTDEEEESVKKKIQNIKNHLDDFVKYKSEIEETMKSKGKTLTNLNNDDIIFKKTFGEKLDKAEKVSIYYQNIITKLQSQEADRTKMVNVDCIFNVLQNGVATAFPMTLLFLIFFLIFMFIPVGF